MSESEHDGDDFVMPGQRSRYSEPEELPDYELPEDFTQHARESLAPQLAGSALITALVNSDMTQASNADIKQALELGMALLMNKPLVVAVTKDGTLNDALRRAAVAVVEVDFENPEGFQQQMNSVLTDLENRGLI